MVSVQYDEWKCYALTNPVTLMYCMSGERMLGGKVVSHFNDYRDSIGVDQINYA